METLETGNRSAELQDGTGFVLEVYRAWKPAPWRLWIAPYGDFERHDRIRIDECILVDATGTQFRPTNLQGMVLDFHDQPSSPGRVAADQIDSDGFDFKRADVPLTMILHVTAFHKDYTVSSSVVKRIWQ